MVEYLKVSFWGAVARKTLGMALVAFLGALPANLALIEGTMWGTDVLRSAAAAGFAAAIGVVLPILQRIAGKEASTRIPDINSPPGGGGAPLP